MCFRYNNILLFYVQWAKWLFPDDYVAYEYTDALYLVDVMICNIFSMSLLIVTSSNIVRLKTDTVTSIYTKNHPQLPINKFNVEINNHAERCNSHRNIKQMIKMRGNISEIISSLSLSLSLDWCCSVSMVWVQITSREEQKFGSSKI